MQTRMDRSMDDCDAGAAGQSLGRPNNLMWNMTRKCNFRCSYCYFPHDASPVTETLPVERILRLLDQNPSGMRAQGDAGKDGGWLVGLTGGEPLLYPGFVDICRQLTEANRIGLDSNLSVSPRVREFAARVDPGRVDYIYASLHIEERERVRGVEAFIANVVLLQERGFRVIVNSVLHPSLVDRYPEDRERLARGGVTIVPRPFKGEYDGKRYPEAYGPEVRAIFAEHPQAGTKMVYNFKGVPCYGGMRFTRLEPDGTLLRCSGDKTRLGNVLDDVRLNTSPLPCAVTKCPCRGLDWVVLSPEQEVFVEGLRLAVIGDRPGARRAWEGCLAMRPEMSNAEHNLAVLAWEAGEQAAARDGLQRALAMHPGHELYAANLARTEANQVPRLSNEVAPRGVGCPSPGSGVSDGSIFPGVHGA